MLRVATDHDFSGRVLRGLLRREPDLDVVRVGDVGLAAASDPVVLEWAATEGRVLLTRDRSTMPKYARDRVAAGNRVPGVIVVSPRLSIGKAIDEVLLVVRAMSPEEIESAVVVFLPL